jgi:hypothetical protein
MLIAIDYDETWSRDPAFWLAFTRLAVANGHRVIGVTARDDGDRDDMCKHYRSLTLYCTGGKMKRKFVTDRNINVDVWIDDSPEFIGNTMALNFDDEPEAGRTW